MDEEKIYKLLTKNKSGTINSLDDLEKCGKTFFYACIHLLLKKETLAHSAARLFKAKDIYFIYL